MKNKFGIYLRDYLDSKNMSINEFAEKIGTTSKNLIDILNGNIELSFNMIYNISFVTGISADMIINLESNNKFENKINEYLKENNMTITQLINKFNYKEAAELYDIQLNDIYNKYTIMLDIMKYLEVSDINSIYKKDNYIFYKSNNDKVELLSLWLERCYKLSLKQNVLNYDSSKIMELVNYIKDKAKNNIFDEKDLINVFNKYGIYLVIEDDLKGSKIRGAFIVLKNKPAIFLTRKHKRYADIYFALLHELAHCKSDFNRAKKGSIVSLYDNDILEDYEFKADKTALNWMVDDKLYNDYKNNISDLDSYDVVKSFFVYRLAIDGIISYSSSIYQKYNTLI